MSKFSILSYIQLLNDIFDDLGKAETRLQLQWAINIRMNEFCIQSSLKSHSLRVTLYIHAPLYIEGRVKLTWRDCCHVIQTEITWLVYCTAIGRSSGDVIRTICNNIIDYIILKMLNNTKNITGANLRFSGFCKISSFSDLLRICWIWSV